MLHWVSNASILLYTCTDVHIYIYMYICNILPDIFHQQTDHDLMEQRYFRHGVGFRKSRLADSFLRTILF